MTSVLLPSPSAAALGKFTEVPVSLYTGIPSISIPLWQIQRGDIQVAVGLSYHSGGIRVDEFASNVGLGWALNAGGMITRATRGLPDDPATFATGAMPQIYRFLGLSGSPMTDQQRRGFVAGVQGGQYDAEPDSYSLSINGLSCQFFLNKDGYFVHTNPELNLRIQYNVLDAHGTRYKWLVTDGKGIQYKFRDAEHTTTTPFSKSGGTTSSAGSNFDGDVSWGLAEIEDTKGNSVQFQYVSEGNSFTNITNEYHTTVSYSETNEQRCIGKESAGYSYLQSDGTALRLTAITCGQEEVRFEAASTSRADLLDGHALQRATVYYAGQPKRAFRFFTSYAGCSPIGTYGTYYADSHNQSRLQLDSLREESADGQLAKPAYQFTYYPGVLPYRGSAAQDHWGFYNGQDNRTRVDYVVGGQHVGAQKDPAFAYTLIGTLASIRYPTGGRTTFTYEANRYRRNPANIPIPQDTTFARVIVDTFDGQDGNTPGDPLSYEAEQIFEIPADIVSAAPGLPPRAKIPLRLTMRRLVNEQPVSTQNGFAIFVEAYKIGVSTPIAFAVRPDSGAIAYLTPGQYRLFVKITKEFPWQSDHRIIHMDASLTTDIATSAFAASREHAGPGLRIKSIQKDFGGGHTETLTYRYTDPATGSTSGLLGSTPDYIRHQIVTFVWDDPDSGSITTTGSYICGCTKYSSDSHYPLVNSRGSYVGYSHVAEYRDQDGTQGYKAYTYTNFDRYNDLNAVSLFPYPPAVSYDSRRGLPEVEQVYAGSGQASVRQFALVQTDSTQYDELSGSLDWAYGVKLGDSDDVGGLENGQDVPYTKDSYSTTVAATYRLETSSFQPIVKKSAQLAQGKALQTNTSTQYTPTTFLPRRLSSTTSDGSTSVQRLYYPADYATSAANSPLLTALLDAHQVSVPLEQNTLRRLGTSARLTVGTVHAYATYTDPSGTQRLFLQRIYVANTNQADTLSHYSPTGDLPAYYEERSRLRKITSHAQPLVAQTKRYQVQGYHWGYEDRYPLASCLNATDTEFFYDGFEESATAKVGAAQAGTRYIAGPYTVTWTRPNTRAYWLSYWYRQQGRWQYRRQVYAGSSAVLQGGDAYDEVRIYPQDAQLTTYTYEPLVGMTSETAPDGRTTSYEYDRLGRLVRTRDEQGRILSQQQYHYAKH